MIDLKLLRDDPERVRASQRARGEDPGLVDALLAADVARRAAVSTADTLRADQKVASKSVGKASAADLLLFHVTDEVEEAVALVSKEAGR